MSSASLAAEVMDAHLLGLENAPQLAEAYKRIINREPHTFSWFVCRFTSPPMHGLFMAPKNTFRMQEAVISVLPEGLFRTIPLAPLIFFRVLYYAMFTLRFATSYLRRRRNAKSNFTGGTSAHDEISRYA